MNYRRHSKSFSKSIRSLDEPVPHSHAAHLPLTEQVEPRIAEGSYYLLGDGLHRVGLELTTGDVLANGIEDVAPCMRALMNDQADKPMTATVHAESLVNAHNHAVLTGAGLEPG